MTAAGILTGSLTVGLGAALLGYDVATSGAADSTAAADATPAVGNGRRTAVSKFAPCRRPARLEDGVCVIDEVRTVVVAAGTAARVPATAQPARRAPAPAAPAVPAAPGSDHEDDDWDDDDHDDDHHDDDDHDDDDDRDDHHGDHDDDDDDHDDDD